MCLSTDPQTTGITQSAGEPIWRPGATFISGPTASTSPPRLDHEQQCLLVLIGTDASGRKELLAVEDGFRESAQSWGELLLRLRDENGLVLDPELATGDGALGFWQALHEVWPKTRQQRCWVHKTANVLNVLPKSVHGKAKQDLHSIYEAESRKEAEDAFDRFVAKYSAKYEDRTSTRLNSSHANISYA